LCELLTAEKEGNEFRRGKTLLVIAYILTIGIVYASSQTL